MKSFNSSLPYLLLDKLMVFLNFIKNKADVILNGASVFFYFALGLRAVTHLDTAWDSLAYHLPFAARLSGIFPKTEYAYDSYFESLYLGVPKLTEFLQGVFWRFTGLVSAANFVGLISILLVALVAAKRLKIKFWMATLFLFSVPLVVIHSVISYNDLPANSFITIAFIGLVASFEDDCFDLKNLTAILIPLAISANLKYQTTLIASMFFALIALIFIYKNLYLKNYNGEFSRFFTKYLAVCLVCGLLLVGNLIYNLVQFKNPFFPLAARFGSIYFDGPLPVGLAGESQDTNVAYRYIVSLSELHLWVDNRGGLWTIDMSNSGKDSNGVNFKTGGYFVANLALWTSFLLLGSWYSKDKKFLNYLIIVLGSFFIVGFLPVPYYLRYWLFLPMNLSLTVLLLFKKYVDQLGKMFALVLVLQASIFLFVIHNVKNEIFPPSYSWIDIRQNLYDVREVGAHPSVDVESPVCVVFEDTRQGFLYKLSNPDLTMQSVTREGECIYNQILYYP